MYFILLLSTSLDLSFPAASLQAYAGYKLVQWGMSDRVDPINPGRGEEHPFLPENTWPSSSHDFMILFWYAIFHGEMCAQVEIIFVFV